MMSPFFSRLSDLSSSLLKEESSLEAEIEVEVEEEESEPRSQMNMKMSNKCKNVWPTSRPKNVYILIILAILFINCHYDLLDQLNEKVVEEKDRPHNIDNNDEATIKTSTRKRFILLASSHVVLTRDDNGQSLVLTGDDGGGGKGKGKGKGKGGGGDRVVIVGQGMQGGGGGNSNMVMQDAAEREGDVVMNGNSMIIPGEDGHIVLSDTRGNNQQQRQSGPPPNLWAFWAPFLRGRMAYNNPFFGGPFG